MTDETAQVHRQSTRARRRAFWLRTIFLMLGIGVLVPWNAFISAKEYFVSRLCGESMDTNVESVFASVFNLSSVCSLGLIIIVQWLRDKVKRVGDEDGNPLNETGHEEQSHAKIMVILPISLNLLVFVGQTVMVLLPSIVPSTVQVLILTSLVICGMGASIAGAGVVATAGAFAPDLAINPFLEGQSIGGVLVSLANFVAACWEDPSTYWNANCESGDNVTSSARDVLTTLVEDDSCTPYGKLDGAVLCYFLVGSLTLVGCLIGFFAIDKLREAQVRDNYETVDGDAVLAPQPTVDDASPRIGLEMPNPAARAAAEELDGGDGLVLETNKAPVTNELDPEGERILATFAPEPENATALVWSHIKAPTACIFLTFFVTLSLFPGLTSELRSVRECQSSFRLSNDLYTPFSFLLFNVGDLAGRILASKLSPMRLALLSRNLVVASLLRFLFFPLLMICVGGSRADHLQIPSDLFSLVVQGVFAVTNGLLVSTSFIHAPTLLPNQSTDLQERMSEILSFALAFGLLSGSFFSFVVAPVAG